MTIHRRVGLSGFLVLAASLGACSESGTSVSPAVATGDPPTTSTRVEPDHAPAPRSSTALTASTDWSIYRGNPQLQGVASGSIAETPELLWTFAAEKSIVSSAVVHDGRVYFGSDDGNLYALELRSGAKLWSFATEDMIEAPPLVHDGVVYVGSSDFHLYAIDAATGALRWKYETDDKVLGGANIVTRTDGSIRIVVGSYDNKLYGFEPDGTLAWRYETDNYVNGTPAIADGRIVFGGCDAALHVVDAETGEGLEKVPLGEECHVAGSVAIADGAVYFGHYGNAFVRVELETGETTWEYTNPRFPFFSSPAIADDRIVFGGRDKHLHCAARADGTPLWTFKTRRKVDGSPVICGDKVVFGSGDGWLYIVSLADGSELWSYEIGRSIFASPAVSSGIILIGSNDGSLYAFGPATGS